MRHELFTSGMLVVCIDDENLGGLIEKNQTYVVHSVSERGALLNLVNVPRTLASSRFMPVAKAPAPPAELDYVG